MSARPYSGRRFGVAFMLTLATIRSASAQYSFDPSAADEQLPGIRYFGAAKDADGAPLPGVTVVFDTGAAMLVFVTDAQGRYRGKLPLDTTPGAVTARCSKPGYTLDRISKRPGPRGSRTPVQVDCFMRAQRAR